MSLLGYASFMAGFVGLIYIIISIIDDKYDPLFIVLIIVTPYNFYTSIEELIKSKVLTK